jgi:mono/diheme cytochrome c family protein
MIITSRSRIRTVLGTIASALFLSIASAGCAIIDPNPDAVIAGPAPLDTTALTGEAIYLKYCVGCHGTNGVPFDTAVTDLRNYTGSFLKLDTTLNTGPGSMPIYPYSKIDTALRHLLYEHIRTFR